MVGSLLFRLWLVAILAATIPGLLNAQGGATGTLVGFVTDATGAVVPDATVSIRNLNTNITQTDRSSAAGEYSFRYIPPGDYEIRATKTGFRASVLPKVKLDTGATFRADVSLQLGEVTETVEVAATAPIIQTEEASVGHLVEQKRIVELPLNGRKFEQLQMLSPGSVNALQSPVNRRPRRRCDSVAEHQPADGDRDERFQGEPDAHSGGWRQRGQQLRPDGDGESEP